MVKFVKMTDQNYSWLHHCVYKCYRHTEESDLEFARMLQAEEERDLQARLEHQERRRERRRTNRGSFGSALTNPVRSTALESTERMRATVTASDTASAEVTESDEQIALRLQEEIWVIV